MIRCKLNMYRARPVRDKRGKILHEEYHSKELPTNTRIQPDRRWFGTRQAQIPFFPHIPSSALWDFYGFFKTILILLFLPRRADQAGWPKAAGDVQGGDLEGGQQPVHVPHEEEEASHGSPYRPDEG